MIRGAGLARLFTCAALARGAAAHAQEDPNTAAARRHFERAVSLFDAGDAAGALAEFQRTYDLTGRSSVLYNLGATYQALHDYPRAIETLQRYVAATADRESPQRALAQRALAQMAPLVAHLRITRTPPDAALVLDGRAVEGDRFNVGPGTHLVAAAAPGRQPRQVEVTVASGDDREVALTLDAIAPAPTLAPTRLVADLPRPPAAAAPGRPLFWSMVITGGALAVGASVTGGLAVSAQRDYAAHHADDPAAPALASRGRALSWAADVMALGAVAAGVTALVVGLRADDHAASARVLLVPSLTDRSVSAVGVF
jgi:tetratricopeptide (TPR) repeat protein